jgi:N-sulfoglucosamine sulfohydrolase
VFSHGRKLSRNRPNQTLYCLLPTTWAYLNRPPEELYDIRKDPYQLHNLATDSRFANIKKNLGKQLDAFMTQQGDKGVATEMEALTRQMRGREK